MSGTGDFSLEGMTVTGLGRVIGRFQGAARRLFNQLNQIVPDEAEQVAAIARARIGTLFNNPTTMQSAVQVNSISEVSGGGGVVISTVSASGLPYMRIHEYGGVIMTPDIYAYMSFAAARWKAYLGDKSQLHFQHTGAHITVIPERSYLRYALEERRAQIAERFGAASVAALQ